MVIGKLHGSDFTGFQVESWIVDDGVKITATTLVFSAGEFHIRDFLGPEPGTQDDDAESQQAIVQLGTSCIAPGRSVALPS